MQPRCAIAATRRPALRPIALAVCGLIATASFAQEQRVEITGSSIKRIEGETALPVQTIRKEDIAKSGATTAAELLTQISASAAQLADGASITDNTGGQRGFNSANLRGIGTSSTLVLLNGRRMANFASPGDNAGVDLNNIPAGAIERVEVLKDGASAIYGTDAIGGVINFITRRDYRGMEVGASAASTREGGAGKKTATISGGYGDVATQRFNIFGVLDVQHLDSLRSTQREFLRQRPLAQLLPFYMSSRPFPANIRLSGSSSTRNAQLAAIAAAGYRFNGANYNQRTVNLFAPTCDEPASVFNADFLPQACGYDYMADTEIYPESKKLSFISRGVFQINNETQLFAELLKARAETLYVLSPNPTTFTGVSWNAINRHLPNPVSHGSNIELRMRATSAGNRSNEVTSDAERLVVGLNGAINKDWEYSLGLSHAENKTADRYVNGYFRFREFDTALKAGQINPFGPSDATGQALIASLRIDDVARRSSGSTQGIDAKVTGTLGKLAGGDIGAAFGAELRRETQKFTPSALLVSNNIAGDRDSSETDPPLEATSRSRNISSAYAEVNTPFSKQVEMQWAVRYDHYEGVGSTVNPKAGLRFQPNRELLVRASAGTGFRAPTFSELHRPTTYGTSPAFIFDSVIGDFDQWSTIKQSNPQLKPEKSRQFSLGLVVEPTNRLSFSVDYWNIAKRDVISDLSEKTILENPTRYAQYITRNSFDEPTILLRKENQGKLQTSGVDLELNLRGVQTALGRFSAGISGTYVIEYKRQFGREEPLVSNVGRFLNDQVIQRWRHRASIDWSVGAFGLTLANTYYSAYTDDSYIPDTAPRKVSAYTLWDLSGSWKPNKNLTVRAGIKNLLDAAPPFSNQSYYFLATYDPTYTDPRGRTFTASVLYSF
jgi:iron complex outermembrane recepter protein